MRAAFRKHSVVYQGRMAPCCTTNKIHPAKPDTIRSSPQRTKLVRWGLLCRVGSLVLGPGLAAVVAVAGVAEQAALAADLLAGARLLLALGLLGLIAGLVFLLLAHGWASPFQRLQA